MNFKNLLQQKRYESGLFARKVAKDLGISRATLYRKESGITPLKQIEVKKFSDYYGIGEEEIKKRYKVAR